jgi:uncharacterized protein YaaW (UPF0174 family)
MKDLEFLYHASNEDLRLLCDIIVKDRDGAFRMTESLSHTSVFKQNYPSNIKGMLSPLVNEFREFGGNSFANLFRGEGPEYSEILRDVAKRNKVNFNNKASNERIEALLLQKLFEDSIENASDEDLKRMMDELGYPTSNFTRQAATVTLMAAWRAGGFQSYILLVSVVNAVMKFLIGRGLSIAANAALTRMASILMGPVGWVLTALWTLIDIAGPAYRVTVPAVIQIAYIRQSVNNPSHLLSYK